MTPTAASPAKLKPGQKRRYIARVHDAEGNHLKHGDDWFRVITRTSPDGEFAMRKTAQAALERAIANYPKKQGKLAGHVTDVIVNVEPRLEDIDWTFISTWLDGDVVNPKSVPAKYRPAYTDTLQRAALAAYRYGHVVWVNDSFRTKADQQERWQVYLNGGPLAARPGTSPHERGIALDIPNVRNAPALIREMRKLDLIDDVPSEIWHLTNHHFV